MSYQFFLDKNGFENSKRRFSLGKEADEALNLIKQNPITAGRPFTGPLKIFRHIKIRRNYSLLYVICREARSSKTHSWRKALTDSNRNFRICDLYCNAICIEQPEESVMIFRIINHQEENNNFGHRT